MDAELTQRTSAALDARLETGVAAPLCVGVSGGGDSVALLALACDWAKSRGRRVLALSVAHGLQAGSEAWSRLAIETAERLGAEGRVLRWDGSKPKTGLSAAARAARHRLLAEAARAAGAKVILLAHTADDIDEAALMRAEGSTLGEVRDWAPSPAWPEGRGVFLLRPLLGERREALRDFLRGRGLGWIEDPANADPKYARARARSALSNHRRSQAAEVRIPATVTAAAPAVEWREVGGGLSVDRKSLGAGDPAAARRFLSAAVLCGAGTTRPPRGGQMDALIARLRGEGAVDATLAGARITAAVDEILIGREMPRGGLSPLPLTAESVSVWDGRFEISVKEQGFRVVPAAGRMARLSAPDRKQLQGLSPILRGSQPLLIGVDMNGSELRPVLAGQVASVRPLAADRLTAALGGVDHERDIASGSVAPEQRSSYVG